MTPAHTRKGGKLYRYYVSTDVLKRDADACTVRRVPAAEIESTVVDQLRGLLRTPEIIVGTYRTLKSMRQWGGSRSDSLVEHTKAAADIGSNNSKVQFADLQDRRNGFSDAIGRLRRRAKC